MPFADIGQVSMIGLAGIFTAAAVVIVMAGVSMSGVADRLADRTGLGEAVAGGLLLGMATSLSGSVVSVGAAIDGRASLAFANAVGGIAAQTAFLAIADLVHRRANLEHASAELANVVQCALLALMLTLPVLAMTGPQVAILGVHPVSIALPVIYVLGARAAARVRTDPMWHPVRTSQTRSDRPDEAERRAYSMAGLIVVFILLSGALLLAGLAIARASGELADRTGISETAIGALLSAVVTSLPELVTTLAAVRRGALQLAVGGIIGGNTFDVLFLTFSDIAYRDGPIYAQLVREDLFWVATAAAMTAVLILGLVIRERRGPGGIGFESTAILGLYLAAIAVQGAAG